MDLETKNILRNVEKIEKAYRFRKKFQFLTKFESEILNSIFDLVRQRSCSYSRNERNFSKR